MKLVEEEMAQFTGVTLRPIRALKGWFARKNTRFLMHIYYKF